MAWVEVEEDEGSWVLIAGVVGIVSGAAVWWQRDLSSGFFPYLGVAFAVILARIFWSQVWLPWEARRAATVVLNWFSGRFPAERVKSVAVRAIESERYIISVRHGFGMPTPRTYFSISRPELTQIAELPNSEWWPRGLK